MPDLQVKPLVDMESQHRIIICLETNGHSAAWVNGGHPRQFVFSTEVCLGLYDKVEAHFASLPKYCLLPLCGIFLVFEEGSGGVDFHHLAPLEVVCDFLCLNPLRLEVIYCHVVPDVIEVTAKCTARFPPPSASPRSEDHCCCCAW